MIENTPEYQRLHKLFYFQFLDELEPDIQKQIYNNPDSDEAIIFNAKIDTEVKTALGYSEEKKELTEN